MIDPQTMCGFINVDKPEGCTSRDVVNRIQKLAGRNIKIGHAGTLDPLATGVLVICVGRATKLVPWLHELTKDYEAKFLLGQSSNTDDVTGEVTRHEGVVPPTSEQIASAVASQIGVIMQRPPAFSAIKIDGQRAYKAARRGDEVDLDERPVTVHDIQILREHYPELSLCIECGSGTYIRSIGRDIGEKLGCGATMSALTRTAIGPFSVGDAITLEELDDDWQNAVLPPVTGLSDMPQVTANDHMLEQLRHGRPVSLEHTRSRVLIVTEEQGVAAILERSDSHSNTWRAVINWVPAWFEAARNA